MSAMTTVCMSLSFGLNFMVGLKRFNIVMPEIAKTYIVQLFDE